MQLLLLIALGPAIALAVYIYRKDGVEHEPVNLLVRLAGFGALSCVPAALAEMAIGSVIHSFVPQQSYLGAFLDAFVAKKALQRRVPPLCTLGGKYKVFVFLTRLLPTRLMTDIVGKIYAS